MTLPLAHVGHYLWVLYLLPIAFVVIGIVKTTLSERGNKHEEEAAPPGGGVVRGPRTDTLARPQDPSPRQDPRAGCADEEDPPP
jgi:hypothetical protein